MPETLSRTLSITLQPQKTLEIGAMGVGADNPYAIGLAAGSAVG